MAGAVEAVAVVVALALALAGRPDARTNGQVRLEWGMGMGMTGEFLRVGDGLVAFH